MQRRMITWSHQSVSFHRLGGSRKRLKAESSARSRAMLRLQPAKQAQHLADRKRKRDAAPKPARAARQQRVHAPLDSDWQRCEMERQLMEQEAAAAVEHDRRREAQRRRDEKASVLVRLFDAADDAGQVVRRDQVPVDALFLRGVQNLDDLHYALKVRLKRRPLTRGWVWTWESQWSA